MSTMIQTQNNLNQTIPQSNHSSGKSVLNINIITAEEPTGQIIVSPVSKTDVPHRNHDRLITHTTAKKKVTQKRQQINESGDSSKITAATTGTENQPEQHDPEHGNESK